jgi:predicted amidophosphoribosyltransferase
MRCIVCGKEMKNTLGGNYHCENCGNAVNDLVNRPSNCDIPIPQGFGKQEGWICPVCGRGLSPWTSFCPCQGSDMKITYGTSPGTEGMNSMQDYYEQWTKQHNTTFDGELKS